MMPRTSARAFNPPPDVQQWIEKLFRGPPYTAEALANRYSRRWMITHRDLKPQNMPAPPVLCSDCERPVAIVAELARIRTGIRAARFLAVLGTALSVLSFILRHHRAWIK